MGVTFASIALLISVLAFLIAARGRSLLIRMAVETVLLLAIISFLAWRKSSPLPYMGDVPVTFEGAWTRAFAVIWWLLGARLVVNITVIARGRDPRARNAHLFSDLAAAVIYLTAGVIILNSVLGFNVKGLLVTSGVIAIVLGLALQNTLSDVFAGIAVGLERPFQVGDQVLVGDGVEGVIVQINWRSIRIQTDSDDLATVPNSIVSKGPIINRSVPTRRRAASVQIVAPAHAPSDAVIELMRQAGMLSVAILPLPAPAITICRSGLFSATYAVRFYVADSPDVGVAKSMFLRQARRLFLHAGIGHSEAMSTKELLVTLPPFQSLSVAELEALARTCVVHAVELGETLFEQGAAADSLFVIEAGVMECSRQTLHDEDEPLGRLGAGDYVGEVGLIAKAPRAFTLKALTRGRVLELPADDFRLLLESNPVLSASMKRSAQRGQASINRADAAHASHPTKPGETLLERAKTFLRF